MIFDLSNKPGSAQEYFDKLKEKGGIIEIKRIQRNRSNLQNRALHLLFEQVAKELNRLGIPFVYRGLKGMEMETTWTALLFKEFTWKPIQQAMFGIESTTKINTQQINEIFAVINKFFAERGVEVTFPNEFDYYLKFYQGE